MTMSIGIAWGLVVDWGLRLILALWFVMGNGAVFNLSPQFPLILKKKRFKVKITVIFFSKSRR